MRYAIDSIKINNELGWLPEKLRIKSERRASDFWIIVVGGKKIISGEHQNNYEKKFENG